MSETEADFVTVITLSGRIEAELLASELRTMNIESMISAPDAGGVLDAIPGNVRLLVPASNAAQVRDLLESRNSSSPPRPSKPMPLLNRALLAFALVALALILARIVAVMFAGGPQQ
jgi:hypothetical protein